MKELDATALGAILIDLSAAAGHGEISYRLEDSTGTGNTLFAITDEKGVSFSGYILQSWRALPPDAVKEKLIAKYPLAFTPKIDARKQSLDGIRQTLQVMRGSAQDTLDGIAALEAKILGLFQ
jgi:hypothetical protein